MTVLISCSAERRQSCGKSEPCDNLDPEATLRMPAAVKGWLAETPRSLQAPSGTTGADCPHPIPVNIASTFDKCHLFSQPHCGLIRQRQISFSLLCFFFFCCCNFVFQSTFIAFTADSESTGCCAKHAWAVATLQLVSYHHLLVKLCHDSQKAPLCGNAGISHHSIHPSIFYTQVSWRQIFWKPIFFFFFLMLFQQDPIGGFSLQILKSSHQIVSYRNEKL